MQKRYVNSVYSDISKILIKIEEASISFDDQPLLQNVNLHVEEGELIYIIGRVGSGKSSLLKGIYAECEFDEGKAEVLGMDLITLKKRNIPNLRRQMGIVFQDYALLRRHTIHQNLDFVLRATGWKKKQEREERILEVLKLVELDDRFDRYPHELSGGEQQRVAIARSILNKPRLILADEPTGNLDSETAKSIVAILNKFRESGTAVVMITHNMNHLKHFPGRIYECGEGTVKEIELAHC